jgi:flagellar basal body-associated protein FliL
MIYRADRDRPPILSKVYRGLIICLIALGLVLAGGTVYGIFFLAARQGNRQAVSGLGQSRQQTGGQGQTLTFTGIGRIRVPTRAEMPAFAADPPSVPQPGMALLFVTFVYSPDDRAFSEELALRVRDFREIITEYIGSFSAAELQRQSEEKIKTELLRRFNAILRLGQIETLYFSDFMIVG